MAKSWFSAQELAGLPGLPSLYSSVIKVAKKNLWQSRSKLRGKGLEYALESVLKHVGVGGQKALFDAIIRREGTFEADEAALPAPMPAAAVRPAPAARPASTAVAPAALVAEEATAAQRIVRDARLSILNAVQRAVLAHDMSASKAVDAWLAALADGSMPAQQQLWCALANDRCGMAWDVAFDGGMARALPAPGVDVGEYARKVSKRSIQRWIAERMAGGDDALIPGRPQKDMGVPAWAPYFLAEMQKPQKPSLSSAYRKMAERLAALGWQPHDGRGKAEAGHYPSYSAVSRWYDEKYSKLDAARGRNTGSAMNPFKFAHSRTAEGMWPLLEVHSDGWNTHFTAPHPVSGKFVTFELWHSHDVATRKAYVHERSVGLSENMQVILGSLYAVCVEDGEPVIWQTDNTGSVKNDRVEFDPCASIASRRGISIVHNLPGNSQANGIAESFNRYLDERAKELATYQGKGMDALAHKRVHRITQKMVQAQNKGDLQAAAQLRAEAARVGAGLVFGSHAEARAWLCQVVAEFNDRPHSSLPRITDPATGRRRHMSPNERMAQFVAAGWERKPLTGEELADAFRVHERKTVVRGTVKVLGQTYHHAELDLINGEQVLVAYDLEDGARVWVKDLEGRLVCEAPFYESRAYRCRSFVEIALETRADAQQRRLGKKIDDIEAQRPRTVLEAPASPALPDFAQQFFAEAIDAPARELLEVQAEALPEAEPEAAVTPENVRTLPGKAHRYDDPTDLALYLYGDRLDEEDERGDADFKAAVG